ncbi:Hypothetical predicted protein [Lecanosticta acicola]|uniref:Uncharacterized protein n=1 Tax=Lecanosticta acicola TaxID=111012 RepID=A0AAI9EDR5_9PEZI|nr:Hypothetical predicted protein [Lecanosticta acicola]
MSRSFHDIPDSIKEKCGLSLSFKESARLYLWRTQQIFIGRGLLTSEQLGYTARDVEDLRSRWRQDEARYTDCLSKLDIHSYFGPAAVLDPYKDIIISDVYDEIARADKQQGKFWHYLQTHTDYLGEPNFYIIDGVLFDSDGRTLPWDGKSELPTSSGIVSPHVENQDTLQAIEEAMERIGLSPSSSRRETPRDPRDPSPEEGPSRRRSQYAPSYRDQSPEEGPSGYAIQYDSPPTRSSTPRVPSARQPSRRGDEEYEADQPLRRVSGGSSYRTQNIQAALSSRRTPVRDTPVRDTRVRRSEPRRTDYEDEYPPPTPRSARTPPSSSSRSQRSTASGQDYGYDDSRQTPTASRRNTYTAPQRRSPAPHTSQRRLQTNYNDQYD